jgi:hypothetical protein
LAPEHRLAQRKQLCARSPKRHKMSIYAHTLSELFRLGSMWRPYVYFCHTSSRVTHRNQCSPSSAYTTQHIYGCEEGRLTCSLTHTWCKEEGLETGDCHSDREQHHSNHSLTGSHTFSSCHHLLRWMIHFVWALCSLISYCTHCNQTVYCSL